jgi:hypothetical protein
MNHQYVLEAPILERATPRPQRKSVPKESDASDGLRTLITLLLHFLVKCRSKWSSSSEIESCSLTPLSIFGHTACHCRRP